MRNNRRVNDWSSHFVDALKRIDDGTPDAKAENRNAHAYTQSNILNKLTKSNQCNENEREIERKNRTHFGTTYSDLICRWLNWKSSKILSIVFVFRCVLNVFDFRYTAEIELKINSMLLLAGANEERNAKRRIANHRWVFTNAVYFAKLSLLHANCCHVSMAVNTHGTYVRFASDFAHFYSIPWNDFVKKGKIHSFHSFFSNQKKNFLETFIWLFLSFQMIC